MIHTGKAISACGTVAVLPGSMFSHTKVRPTHPECHLKGEINLFQRLNFSFAQTVTPGSQTGKKNKHLLHVLTLERCFH